MKKNAFTLVELLAVIAILALIALVVFPAINTIIKTSKEDAYEAQKETVIKAAKEYYFDHTTELPAPTEGATKTSLEVDTLVSEGYISDSSVVDPRNSSKTLDGYIKVTYKSNQYIYEYVE